MRKSNTVTTFAGREKQMEQDEPPLSSGVIYDITPKIKPSKKQNTFNVMSPSTRAFIARAYPNVTDEQWNDWTWQIKNRVRTREDIEKFVNLSNNELAALSKMGCHAFPFAITPYYLSLISVDDEKSPVRLSVVPTAEEYEVAEDEAEDPLGEEDSSPVHGLVHRYPNRVLFLATDFCSTCCRYCTRSRLVAGVHRENKRSHWEAAFEYIENHPEIEDVLISGGDPLTLPTQTLEYLLSRLHKIEHLKYIRIGTKVPAVLPQRITPSLVRMLKQYHPLFISIHFTHTDELTPETKEACRMLSDAGIPLGSQTVLLKGINDNVDTMRKLMMGLLSFRVRPYYLYQCDPIKGSKHFRTSVQKGLDIIKGLRGFISGYAIPHYVIDAPGGGGKTPLLPDYAQGHEGSDLILKNYAGKTYKYPDMIGE